MSVYEEVEIEDLDFDPVGLIYTYPCPCGDKFRISLEDLWDGEDIAPCPSCTLRIMIIYDEEDLPPLPDGYFDDSDSGSGSDEEDAEKDVEKSTTSASTSSDEDSLAEAVEKKLNV